MHDQSATRTSGRTPTAVPAMCVRAMRITVLRSAGIFARNEYHDLNAEKIRCVKCLCLRDAEFVACRQFSNAGASGWVRKFLAMINWCCGRCALVLLDHIRRAGLVSAEPRGGRRGWACWRSAAADACCATVHSIKGPHPGPPPQAGEGAHRLCRTRAISSRHALDLSPSRARKLGTTASGPADDADRKGRR